MYRKLLQFRSCRLGLRSLSRTGVIVLIISFGMSHGLAQSHWRTAVTPNGTEYRADQILIQPKKGVSPAALAKFHATQKVAVTKKFEALGNSQVLRVPPGETALDLVDKYQQSGLVEFAEPDYIFHANAAPNDPLYTDGTEWWLNNTGQTGGIPGADIKAPQAWDVLHSASNIIVAVLDSGVRYTHEDLAANMWVNPLDGTHGFNALTSTNDPNDDGVAGHGTFCAGLIGAVGNNGVGMAGVAWKVQIMACKCLDSQENGSEASVVACMEFARTNGAEVLNCSFSTSPGGPVTLLVSNEIVVLQNSGVIVVASCGNGLNTTVPHFNVDNLKVWPACLPMDNIISVLYTTATNTFGTFSDFGHTTVDLGAPGDQMSSTFNNADNGYFISTSTSGFSGTSFAGPLVAGACALVLEKYPGETYQQTISRILKATDPEPDLAGKCVTGGRLNLLKALSPPISLGVTSGTNLPVQMQVSAGPNRMCVIQSSTDMLSWSPVFTNATDTNGVFGFTDNNSTNAPTQFYRVTAAP